MAQSLDRVQAAAVDGRARNIFYRQQEIESLYRTLLDNAEKLRQAIISDFGYTQNEVAVEFDLTLSSLRRDYASLQPKKSHEQEYAIANGKDAPEERVPVGIVCIEPTAHTLLYSTLVPLSAAIAAGNCVVLVLQNTLRATSNLLRQLLSSALSADTFIIASSSITDSKILDKAILVDQDASDIRQPKANELDSLPKCRTIAVVDRTASVQDAARELVSARFAFGGASPYAPDVVLVNEFAKKDFLQAVLSECVNRESGATMNGTSSKSNVGSRLNKKLETMKQQHGDLRVIAQESTYAVIDVPTRLDRLPTDKNTDPVLIVCSMRSLDDAIDLLGRSSSEPYLAAYHFSNLASAKYLSQFVDSQVTFVNHVPRELLVGPAYPLGRPFSLSDRYPISLFELARPTLVNQSAKSASLSSALDSLNTSSSQQIWKAAVSPLVVMKRTEGGGVGFFEQGFLMNAALLLATTVAVSSTGAWYLWRYSRR